MSQFRKIIILFASLLLTPVILFISTTSGLYLQNQMNLAYSHQVIYPFILLAVIGVGVGIILFCLRERRIARFLLRLFYGLGPFYLLYTTLRNSGLPLMESAIGLIILFIIFFAIFITITKRIKDSSFRAFFAFLGIFFLIFEVYSFYSRFESAPEKLSETPYRESHTVSTAEKLPNIYLLLLDGFQTEMFEVTKTPQVKKSLKGFVQFHENTSLFGRTGMSIPSIFGGKSYGFNGPQEVFKESSLTSDSSILGFLKEAGYSEYAYVRDELRGYNNLSLFDHIIEHEDKESGYTPHYVFRGAWIYRNLPQFVSIRILGDKRLKQIKEGDTLAKNASVSSYKGMLRYLSEERKLPDSNRFTFVYALIPHKPFIFKEDCSYSEDFSETDALGQSKCAASIIVKFIENLKSAGRFKDSMIVITADHGLSFRIKDQKLIAAGSGKLNQHWAQSRALLLIKPSGTDDTGDLIISEFQSSTLDIAPTIAASLPSPPAIDFEGVSLLNPIPPLKKRKKYYYFFDKKGVVGWTDEMERYIIEDNEIRDGGIVMIENNGPPSTRYQKTAQRDNTDPKKRPGEAKLRAEAKLLPDHVVPHLNLAGFYIEQERYGEARTSMERAIELEPGDHRLRLRLAFILAQLGQINKAEEELKTILKSFPKWNEALSALGNVYFLQNRMEEALKHFLLAIEASPGESESIYNAALSLERLGRGQEAVKYYKKFISTAPKGYEEAKRAATRRIETLKGSR